MGCFRVLEFDKSSDGKLVANSGDSFVFAVEFSQPPRAYTVVAYSQSDVDGSPHFSDQAPLFSASKMKRAAFTDAGDPGPTAQDLPSRAGVSPGGAAKTLALILVNAGLANLDRAVAGRSRDRRHRLVSDRALHMGAAAVAIGGMGKVA